ncbi:MAG TPA: LpqB family beta-propeller domain-containing protein [Gemmatimonadaceae bacterium]|nr:LpqB family beta-propeller domain-containing protein [Gemmatimonadaceae bacterium]
MRGIRVVPALVALAFAVACGAADLQAPQQEPKPVATVQVTSPSQTLTVGGTMTMVAATKAADGSLLQRGVTWSSENEQVATVDAKGIVTAIAPGQVTIVAASGTRAGTASIVVTAIPTVPVAEVRLSVDEEVQLEWNGIAQLRAVALDAEGAALPGRFVSWTSSKPSVFTVTQDGLVTAVGAGLANVTAIIDGVPATVGVRVRNAPVTDVVLELSDASTGLEVGEVVWIGTRVKLASGQVVDRALTWTSTNPAAATATTVESGAASIAALAAGEVTLTGSVEGKSATATLRITPRPTHDLLYNRWSAQNGSEIFLLSLSGSGAAPVRLNAGSVSRDPSPSPDGTQFVFAVSQIDQLGRNQNDLYVVNRNGLNMRRLTSDPGLEYEPAWSPDGRQILFSAADSTLEDHAIWVVNVDGTGLKNLTTALPAGVTVPEHPAWSPDGRRIAFIARQNQQHKVWTMNADGSNVRQVTTDAGFDQSPTWSPDGAFIAFSRYNSPAYGWDIAIVPSSGGAAVLRALPGDQNVPAWSPDGHYIALKGTEVAARGPENIYTMRPDGSGLRLRTAAVAWGGGVSPAWVTRW